MKLPDQPSFVLPAESPMEPAGYAVYGPAMRTDAVVQSAPAYLQKASRAATKTKKAPRREPLVVAASSRLGRNH